MPGAARKEIAIVSEWLSYERFDKEENVELFVDFDASLDDPAIKSRFTMAGYLPSPDDLEYSLEAAYEYDHILRPEWTGEPNIDDLIAARRHICAIASEFGGTYAGWGCDADLDLEATP